MIRVEAVAVNQIRVKPRKEAPGRARPPKTLSGVRRIPR